MSAKHSRDAKVPDANEMDELPGEFQGGGAGAASALERMKAEHALRHRRQHGSRKSGADHGDDRAPTHSR